MPKSTKADEQYPEPGSGDRDGGGNLRLDYYDRSHEDKSLPFFGGDDTIREILGTTPHLKASKDEIRAFFEATADENARISYIKRIFNNDYTEVILSDGRRVGYKTYQNVLQLWEDSYLSRTAQSFYDWGVIAQHFEAMRLLGELQDTMKPLPSIKRSKSLMISAVRNTSKRTVRITPTLPMWVLPTLRRRTTSTKYRQGSILWIFASKPLQMEKSSAVNSMIRLKN